MQLRRNEILTGLLVVATLAVLTGVLILLGAPGLFRPLVTYRIYFDNAAGIKLGAPVLLAGRKIGQVARLYSPVSAEESERAVEVAKLLHQNDQRISTTPLPGRPQRFEVRIDVQVDRGATIYRDSKARMMTLGLLGETAIDFTEGTESSGRAAAGELFAGERVPDFGEAISKMLDIVQPVAKEATATLQQLQSTAQNLSQITAENSQLNLALGEFRTFGQHLNELTAPDGSLSSSLKNIQRISSDLAANDNLKVTLENFRSASENLKTTLNSLAPELAKSGANLEAMTVTLKAEPWRLIWPSTKKYSDGDVTATSTEQAITIRKSTKRARPTSATTASPGQ